MYSQENISTIFEFRNLSDCWDGNAANRPSDELILSALDLVRKFHKTPEPNISIHTVGIDTVIKFSWQIGSYGFIEYVLSDDYLKLFVMDDGIDVIVNDVEIDNSLYEAIDFITLFFRKVVMGEVPNIIKNKT